MVSRSGKLMPAALTLTRTAPGGNAWRANGFSRRHSGAPSASQTTARYVKSSTLIPRRTSSWSHQERTPQQHEAGAGEQAIHQGAKLARVEAQHEALGQPRPQHQRGTHDQSSYYGFGRQGIEALKDDRFGEADAQGAQRFGR